MARFFTEYHNADVASYEPCEHWGNPSSLSVQQTWHLGMAIRQQLHICSTDI